MRAAILATEFDGSASHLAAQTQSACRLECYRSMPAALQRVIDTRFVHLAVSSTPHFKAGVFG